MKFVRIDDVVNGLESVALVAFGDATAGRLALRKACFFAWRRQLRKFEDMDEDLSDCQEARMNNKPRDSALRVGSRGDTMSNILMPVATGLMKLVGQGGNTLTWQEGRSPAASERSSSPEPDETVSKEIIRLRQM